MPGHYKRKVKFKKPINVSLKGGTREPPVQRVSKRLESMSRLASGGGVPVKEGEFDEVAAELVHAKNDMERKERKVKVKVKKKKE